MNITVPMLVALAVFGLACVFYGGCVSRIFVVDPSRCTHRRERNNCLPAKNYPPVVSGLLLLALSVGFVVMVAGKSFLTKSTRVTA